MVTIKDRIRIKNELPHGSQKLIAEKSGISRVSISNWFAGRKPASRVENAILDFYIKYKNERDKRLKEAGLL